jgi:hypothetical protein
MKNVLTFGLLILTIALTGCADVTNVQDCIPVVGHTYGFWGGVWHGMISQISFIGSLFNDDIAVYAINNNGGWYNFGFVGGFGVMIKVFSVFMKGLTGK